MKSRIWLFAVCTSLLIACGVESPAADSEPQTDSAQSALSSDANAVPAPVAVPHALHPVGSACTPPAFALCCPFVNGCSCPGTQDCDAASGTWGFCEGAGARGQLCP